MANRMQSPNSGSFLSKTHGRGELDESRPRTELDAAEPLTKTPELKEKNTASGTSEEQSQAARVASSGREIHESDKAKVE